MATEADLSHITLGMNDPTQPLLEHGLRSEDPRCVDLPSGNDERKQKNVESTQVELYAPSEVKTQPGEDAATRANVPTITLKPIIFFGKCVLFNPSNATEEIAFFVWWLHAVVYCIYILFRETGSRNVYDVLSIGALCLHIKT